MTCYKIIFNLIDLFFCSYWSPIKMHLSKNIDFFMNTHKPRFSTEECCGLTLSPAGHFYSRCEWPEVIPPLTIMWEYFKVMSGRWPTLTSVSVMQHDLSITVAGVCTASKWSREDLHYAVYTLRNMVLVCVIWQKMAVAGVYELFCSNAKACTVNINVSFVGSFLAPILKTISWQQWSSNSHITASFQDQHESN